MNILFGEIMRYYLVGKVIFSNLNALFENTGCKNYFQICLDD